MANEHYTPIPDINPSGPNGAYLPSRASPTDFGSGVGSALEGFGGQIERTGATAGNIAIQLQTIHNETETREAVTRANQALSDLEFDYRANKRGLNAADSYKEAQNGIEAIRQQHRASLTNPASQRMFDSEFARTAQNSIRQVGVWAADQTHAAQIQSFKAAAETSAQRMAAHYNDPQAYGQDMNDLVQHAAHWALSQGYDKTTADAMVAHYAGYGAQGMVQQAMAAGGPKAARQLFETLRGMTIPGTDLPVMNAEHSGAVDQQIAFKEESLERREEVRQMRLEAQRERAERHANEAASNTIVNQLIKDPTQFDPSQITDNPVLKPSAREGLFSMYKTRLKDVAKGTHDETSYGTGFYDLFRRVHLPQDDPQRISDPSELYGHVGENGDLTLAGVRELSQEIQGKRTPEGAAEAEMKRQFFANARGQISGTNEGMHIKDPKGDELYLKFMARVLPAYQEGRAAGKSPSQLLDPDSPDYVGKSVAQFKRPMSQWMSDMISDNGGGAAPSAAAAAPGAKFDLTTKEGIVGAYQAGQISRDAAASALVAGGFAEAPKPVAKPKDIRPPDRTKEP